MSCLTESTIADFAIKLFERLGNDYISAPDGDLLAKLMSGEVRVIYEGTAS